MKETALVVIEVICGILVVMMLLDVIQQCRRGSYGWALLAALGAVAVGVLAFMFHTIIMGA